MSDQSHRLATVMPLLQHVISHLGVQATPSGKKLGLTNTRMMALAAASFTGGLTMTELANELGLQGPLATRTVDELVQRGLLERHPDPDDRRRVIVVATKAGVSAIKDVHEEAETIFLPVLARMGPEEADALVIGLEALIRVMHEANGLLPKHRHP